MTRRVLFVVGAIIGITYLATDVAAQVVHTGGNVGCNGQQDAFIATWSAAIEEGYDVVAWYGLDYSYQSPDFKILTPPDGTSDGTETVSGIPQTEAGHDLYGVIVWFEWGYWYNGYWYADGGCDWVEYYPTSRCFAAGTPLLTLEGSKPIEQFKKGDWILSSPYGDVKAPAVASRVVEVIQRDGKLVDISVGGRVVHATREHPFYVKGKGWTQVRSLAADDLLRSHDDRWLPVESVVEGKKSPVPVYNVRMEGLGTYFVGGDDWGFSLWVSSDCGGRPVQSIVDASKPSVYNVGVHENNTHLVRGGDSDLPLRIHGASEKPKTRLQELAQLQGRLPVVPHGEWRSLRQRLFETVGR